MKNKYWSQLNRKQKIDYYFQYYFSWTIAAVAVIAFVSIYAYNVLSKTLPDMYVVSVGEALPTVDEQTVLTDYITENITDVNADGEKYVEYSPISYNLENKSNEQTMMYMQKYMTLLGEGVPRLLIMDKTHYESALIDEQFDGFLIDLSQLSDKHYKKYAIPVSETKLADVEGLDLFNEYYLVMTYMSDDKENKQINHDILNATGQFVVDIMK